MNLLFLSVCPIIPKKKCVPYKVIENLRSAHKPKKQMPLYSSRNLIPLSLSLYLLLRHITTKDKAKHLRPSQFY